MASAGAHCEVRLFGRISVTAASGEAVHLPKKALELLAWLIVHDSASGDRLQVLSDLWADEFDGVAQKSLRNHLYILRRGLKEAGIGDPIISEGGAICLRSDIVESDWQRLFNYIKASGREGGQEAIRACIDAMDWIGGPPLCGVSWTWAEPAQARAHDALRQVIAAGLRAARAAKDAESVAKIVERGYRLQPTNEALCEEWIAHLISMGRMEEARVAHDRLSRELEAIDGQPRKPWCDYHRRPVTEGATKMLVAGFAPASRRRPLRLVVSVALVVSVCAGAFSVFLLPSWKAPVSVEEAEARLIALRLKSGLPSSNPSAELARSKIVAWLCDGAWQAMWTARESDYKGLFTRLDADIRDAFRWSLAHRPDLATEIAGNGHRLFYITQPDQAWTKWIDQVLAEPGRQGSLYQARALCGCALANWKFHPEKGLSAAEQAASIFHRLGSQWDEANAWRHIGLCTNHSYAGRTRWYLKALSAFTSLRDWRGMAMCEQSLSERGVRIRSNRAEEWEGLARWSLRAAGDFRRSGDEHLVNDCLKGCVNFLKDMDRRPAAQALRKRVRNELLTRVSPFITADSGGANVTLLVTCLNLDLALNDRTCFAEDLGELLRQEPAVGFTPRDEAFLFGAYASLHRVSTRLHAGQIVPQARTGFGIPWRKYFDMGRSASMSDLIAVAERVDRNGEPIEL